MKMLTEADSYNGIEKEQFTRTALSKSYYSAYHCCKCIADKLPGVIEGGSHQQVISTLNAVTKSSTFNNEDQERKIKRLGLYLSQAKSIRVDADYNYPFEFNKHTIDSHFDRISKILNISKEVNSFFNTQKVG